MKLEYFVKRNKVSLEQLFLKMNIKSYEDLVAYCKHIGLEVPEEKELNYEFKKDVEKRTVAESNSKKKRISSQKSKKSKTNDSVSSGRSRSKQSVRKSSPKRRRKRDSDKVESVQPISGSEDTK